MDISEFILKLFAVGMLIAGMLGMIFQSATFTAQLRVHDDTRFAIDLAHAVITAPCLAYSIDGEVRKGMLDSEKFASAENNFCIGSEKRFSIRVTDAGGSELFKYGSPKSGSKLESPFPVIIKYPDKIVEGFVDVSIEY